MKTDQVDRADLEALRAAFDPAHREPPLGWAAVRAFEAEHGIVLPEPYRTFVAEICDGYTDGPPDYGLVALAGVPSDMPDGQVQQSLAEPFPLTEAWLWEEDEDDPRSEEEIEAALDRVFGHGSIVLGTDGCAMNWHLIVSGPHRGHVWMVCGEGAHPFGAEFGHTSGRSGFAGWAAHWAAGTPWWDVA
ncbi:SMI1/KNR4 family protein [Actinomadura bangladeshensis]|uniref:SMI1/KNR4 family protein n=1 Tax=Actinomadura bangladeshensis TaxID=453573 RepID=A0A6L9QC69_9ACTN|nr:SMI1/KNR4 family protein [Actinomadura bangladeshensis]NEA23041.1 SMI1/KNR4 family protein [Actinomadura bangladeshensis]